ncbi:MAG: pilus assembly protein PilM [Gammaproteobacteria bacterium]
MTRKQRAKPVLGLDISTSSVKVVELARAGTSYRAQNYAVEPMPANAIADKVILNIEDAGEAVRRACKRLRSRLKDAAVAIGGATVITKTVQIPSGLNQREQEEQIEILLPRIVPFSIDDVSFDFEIKGPSSTDPDRTDVLLVATRRDNVEHRQAVLEFAGLRAHIVDCEVFALENAFKLLDGRANTGTDEIVALVDFGSATTSFSVFDKGRIIYTRDQAFGGRQLTDEIMSRYSLSYEDAGRAKRRGGLPDTYRDEVLNPFVDDMAHHVNRALQFFYAAATEHTNVDRVFICGGCAAIPEAAERIGEKVGTPTRVANPFATLKVSGRAQAQGIEQDAPGLLVACGLALRSFD